MSEKRDPLIFLEDMLTSAEKIVSYSHCITSEGVFEHQETVDAILYNLLVFGEAAKRVPEEIRSANPDIPWRSITGMRDKIIHQYWVINQMLICKAVTEEIPPLISIIRRIIERMDSP